MSRAIAIATVLTALLLCSMSSAQAARSVKRCGYVSDQYGRAGVYITNGKLTCAKAKSIIRYTGTCGCGHLLPVAGSEEKYPNGYTCGGHMGYYFCVKGSIRHPTVRISWQTCSNPGCPAAVRA
jgi:hypothetical protein